MVSTGRLRLSYACSEIQFAQRLSRSLLLSLIVRPTLLWGAAVVVLAWATAMSMIPSLPSADLGLFRQLNQELGALCQAPPSQAVKVCRLHARLVRR